MCEVFNNVVVWGGGEEKAVLQTVTLEEYKVHIVFELWRGYAKRVCNYICYIAVLVMDQIRVSEDNARIPKCLLCRELEQGNRKHGCPRKCWKTRLDAASG